MSDIFKATKYQRASTESANNYNKQDVYNATSMQRNVGTSLPKSKPSSQDIKNFHKQYFDNAMDRIGDATQIPSTNYDENVAQALGIIEKKEPTNLADKYYLENAKIKRDNEKSLNVREIGTLLKYGEDTEKKIQPTNLSQAYLMNKQMEEEKISKYENSIINSQDFSEFYDIGKNGKTDIKDIGLYEDIRDGKGIYKYLDLSERKVYYYLVGKSDNAKIREYILNIKPRLESRMAESVASQNNEDVFWGGVKNSALAAQTGFENALISQARTGVTGAFAKGNMTVDNPLSTLLDPTYKEKLYSQISANAYDKNVVYGLWLDIVNNTTAQIPEMVMGYAGGQGAYIMATAQKIIGSSSTEAINSGEEAAKGILKGCALTALEIAPDMIFGGTSTLFDSDSIAKTKLTSRIIKAIDNTFSNKKTAKLFAKAVTVFNANLGEGAEEFFQTLAEPLINNIIFKADEKYTEKTFEDAVKAFIIGFFSTTANATIGANANVSEAYKDIIGKDLKELSGIDSVIKLAEVSENNSDLYYEIKGKQESGHNISNVEIADLYIESSEKFAFVSPETLNAYNEKNVDSLIEAARNYAANKHNQALQTNKNNDIIDNNDNTILGDENDAQINSQEWRPSGNSQGSVGTLQENLGGNNEQSGTERTYPSRSQSLRNSLNRGNFSLSSTQAENLKDTAIKNPDNTPKITYHFTNNMDFETFAIGDIGFHFGNELQALARGKLLKQTGRIIKACLNIKNPLKISTDIMSWRPKNLALKLLVDDIITLEQYQEIFELDNGKVSYDSPAAIKLRKILAEKGYDGIIYDNLFEADGESYIAFYPEQIIIIDDGKGGNEANSNDSPIGLSEPEEREIFRPNTHEDIVAGLTEEQKTTQQKHILDVAKKLDKDLRIVYVDKDSNYLHGKNGKYIPDSKTMYLAKDLSTLEMYTEVFKHEFTHRLEIKKAYGKFKDYLFNKSSLFESYVKARLSKTQGSVFTGTRSEALAELTKLYYDNFVNDRSIPGAIRERFTMEKAEREIVADFVGRILFKGKDNSENLIQALEDSDLDAARSLESDIAFFEEIARDDRTLLQKVIDAIKDFVANLTGIKQNDRLINDLKYIEQRLSRVYNSADIKNTAKNSGEVAYDIAVLENGNTYVKASRNVITGTTLSEQRRDITKFFKKLLKNNSSLDIHTIEGDILTITMKDTEDKARDNYKIVNGKRVKMTDDEFAVKLRVESHIDEIAETSLAGKKPWIPDTKNHNFATDGFEYRTAYFEDFDGQFYKIEFSVGHNGTVATIYNIGKIKESVPSSAKLIAVVGSQALDESLSNDIILDKEPSVNTNISEEDGLYSSDDLDSNISPMDQARENQQKLHSKEITFEEFLAENDKLWNEANERYGSLPKGENAKNSVLVPSAVSSDAKTKRFVRTIIETDSLNGPALEGMETEVLLGDFGYTVVSDKKALETADAAIKNKTAETIWQDAVDNGNRINKNQIAIGERLLSDAMKNGNTLKVLELSSELADVFTRAGQVVQAARLLKKMTGAGRLVSLQRSVKTLNKDLRNKYGEAHPPIKISEDSAERLLGAKTPNGIEHAYQEILYEIADQMPVTFLDKFNAWRYFSMLSNPRTHIRNLTGNAIFVPMVRMKDIIAASMEHSLDKSKRTKSLLIKKEYSDFAKKDSQNKAVRDLLKGNKYNDKSELRQKQTIFRNKALEFLTTFNSNALEVEDTLFKNKHYIHALAGFLQARNVNLENASADILDEARIYAVNEARKATFNDESALANWIQNFGNKNFATALIVEGLLPYKRTPINIVKRGIEYSPLGLAKTLTKGVYDVKTGKITASEFIDGIASGLTGTGIMLVGMFLASLGAVSGGFDDDKESKYDKLLGEQEYAIKFMGKSYTIDWMAPSSIPFFIGVELVDSLKEGEEINLSDMGDLAWNSLEPVINLSMLSGIQGAIEASKYADSSQTLSTIVGDVLTSYAMQSVPSMFGAVSRTIDPTQRSWYVDKNSKWFDSFSQSVINNVKSKIPGLSYTQVPKIDAWGREVTRGNLAERTLENFISPGYYSEMEYDETSEELKRLHKETGENVFPSSAARKIEYNGETKHLSAEEYVTYAKAKGEYSFDYIYDFVNSSDYDKLDDGQRAKVITNLYMYANAKAKTLVSEYDLMGENSRFKTVTRLEKNGTSAIQYYIRQAKQN